MMKEEDLRSFVYEYLHSRGYKNADDLTNDSRTQPLTSYAVSQSAEVSTSVGNYIQNYSARESRPDRYFQSYAALKHWVDECLDQYRDELVQVLFPVFCHCFLDLVLREYVAEARDFFEKNKIHHVELHGEEIRALSGVMTVDLLRENDVARRFLAKRYTVRLSAYSFELLVGFLQENNFMSVLAILNEHVNVIVLARSAEEQSRYSLQDAKRVKKESTPRPEPIQWNPLDPRSYSDMTEEQRREAVMGKPVEDNEEAMREANDLLGVAQKKFRAQIPVPRLDPLVELEQLRDLRHRIALSSTLLPSVAMMTFHNAADSLNCLSFSLDGSVVAAGMSDSSVRVWELDPQRQEDVNRKKTGSHCLIGHSGPVFSVAVSPDQKFFLSAGEDRTARLWLRQTRANLVCYRGHNFPVWDVAFSDLGYYFATCSHDRTARLWSTDHITPLRVFAGHVSDVDCVRFHPNCHYLGTGSSDKTVMVWDVQSGQRVRTFLGHTSAVNVIAFSPDGKYLASSGEDARVIVWDIGSGRQVSTLLGHSKSVYSLAFSQDGNILVSGGADCTIRVWDMASLRDVQTHSMVVDSEAASAAASKGQAQSSVEQSYLLKTLFSKSTPIVQLAFTRRNLLLAGGPNQL